MKENIKKYAYFYSIYALAEEVAKVGRRLYSSSQEDLPQDVRDKLKEILNSQLSVLSECVDLVRE